MDRNGDRKINLVLEKKGFVCFSPDNLHSLPDLPILEVVNIHGVAPVAELDGDEIGYLVSKVVEIKRQR